MPTAPPDTKRNRIANAKQIHAFKCDFMGPGKCGGGKHCPYVGPELKRDAPKRVRA